MSERYIEIRNWDKFQHKDVWRKSGGRPPWIKAYTALLHDDDWLGLSDAQRGILLGLWLMYASAGRSVYETSARHLLSTNKASSRHFLGNLEALCDAGFIEFVSQPIRAPVAPRVEERRVEVSTPLFVAKDAEEQREDQQRAKGNGWIENLSSYTGCRYVRGEFALTAVRDVLGTEKPPSDWPYPRPTAKEIRAALEHQEKSVA